MTQTAAQKRQRRALSLLALVMMMTVSAQAFALDGYQDRRGIFGGLGIGGGVGLVESDNPTDETGIDQGRKLGLHLQGVLGGGVSDKLTFGAEGNWWIRTVQLNGNGLEHHHLSFAGVANFYLIEGFYLSGGVGLAYAIYDVERQNQETFRYQELGLAGKVGGGFEFFVNSQLAMGMQANYTRHVYSNGDFDTISGGLTLRWY